MFSVCKRMKRCGRMWAPVLAVLIATASVRAESLPLDAKASSLTFVGSAFLHDFRGEAKEMTGSAELDESATPPIQRAALQFRVAALTTFRDDRDKKMREWLKVELHPVATFRLESVRVVSGNYRDARAANPASFEVRGSLSLNGVTRPISGQARGWREGGRVVVAGDAVVNTPDFGLPQIREMLMTVGPNVKTSYRFVFLLRRPELPK